MKIEKIFKNKWLRLTRERKEIFKYFHANHLLRSADLLENFKDISRASVFRALNLFLDLWLVRKINFWDGVDYYELIETEHTHEHMKCRLCNKVYNFNPDAVYRELYSKANDYWFEIDLNHISIVGKCKKCTSKR